MNCWVKEQCPQCGAPVEFEETARLLQCPYCGIGNILYTDDWFRFVLEHEPREGELFLVPYLRFRGSVYVCHTQGISHRIADLAHLAVEDHMLPPSLGFRPQTLTMNYFSSESYRGKRLKSSVGISEVLNRAGRQGMGSELRSLLYRTYIGETLSCIYLPLYLRDGRLFDGVTGDPLPDSGDVSILGHAPEDTNPWHISFLPALCPRCGWNLEGEQSSVILTCSNCDAAWETSGGTLHRISFETATIEGKAVYLPFWKIKTFSPAAGIYSYADFIRVTNQPKVEREEWKSQDFYSWIPAFKIRPGIFLKLARRFTVEQAIQGTKAVMPSQQGRHSVTLPLSEAMQIFRVVFAEMVRAKRIFNDLVPKADFHMGPSVLVFLPFRETRHELIQEDLRISIQKTTLEMGRHL